MNMNGFFLGIIRRVKTDGPDRQGSDLGSLPRPVRYKLQDLIEDVSRVTDTPLCLGASLAILVWVPTLVSSHFGLQHASNLGGVPLSALEGAHEISSRLADLCYHQQVSLHRSSSRFEALGGLTYFLESEISDQAVEPLVCNSRYGLPVFR